MNMKGKKQNEIKIKLSFTCTFLKVKLRQVQLYITKTACPFKNAT